jgi:branched-chain amino acid transport system substrate-binding protein
MKKIIFAFYFLTLLLSCGPTKTVKIGMLTSLTGSYSPLLVTARNGALLAVEEINESKTEIDIEYLVLDDESNKAIARNQVERFLEEGFQILILSTTSGTYAEIESLINSQDVIAISPTISSDIFAEKDDNLIRLTADISAYGKQTAIHVLDENISQTTIVFDSNNAPYAESFYPAFIQEFEIGKPDAVINLIPFNSTQNPDFSEIGEEIKASNPEAVVIIASPFHAGLISQAIYGEGILLMYAPWAISDELIEIGGRSVEGSVFYVLEGFLEPDNPAQQEFNSKYRARFGKESSYQSISNYDTIGIIIDSLKELDDWSPKSIKNFILEKDEFIGKAKNYSFNRFGDASFTVFPFTVKDGKFVRME